MLPGELYQEICELPVIDVHSHLNRDNMAARELRDVMFYHMLLYALRAAGMSEETLFGGRQGEHRDLRAFDQALRYWEAVGDTSFGWALRTILRELYQFDEPITAESLPRLADSFRAKTAQDDWD